MEFLKSITSWMSRNSVQIHISFLFVANDFKYISGILQPPVYHRRLDFSFFLIFFGPLTKHQSTDIVWPKMAEPLSASRAAQACLYVSYSTSAYPFRKPVRRSKFKCIFLMSPYSQNFSCISSSCASSWIDVTNKIQPSTAGQLAYKKWVIRQ